MKHCVITGAADGIGRELALEFARRGYAVTVVDRDRARSRQVIEEIKQLGASAQYCYVDLANVDSIRTLMHELGTSAPIDVYIQNAGVSHVGAFQDSDVEAQRLVIDINLRAPMLMTAALFAERRFSPDATLVFIASLSHHVGYPGAICYAASKDGLVAFARSVSATSRSVKVLTVYPGPTRTAHARRYSPDNSREHRRMSPATLATRVARAVDAGQRHLIPGFGNKVFAVLGRVAPWLTTFIMRKTVFEKL